MSHLRVKDMGCLREFGEELAHEMCCLSLLSFNCPFLLQLLSTSFLILLIFSLSLMFQFHSSSLPFNIISQKLIFKTWERKQKKNCKRKHGLHGLAQCGLAYTCQLLATSSMQLLYYMQGSSALKWLRRWFCKNYIKLKRPKS